MKIIGLLISLLVVSLLFVWWISMFLNRTDKAINTTQQLNEGQNTQTQTGNNPLEYSRETVEKYNEVAEDYAEEINQLP